MSTIRGPLVRLMLTVGRMELVCRLSGVSGLTTAGSRHVSID